MIRGVCFCRRTSVRRTSYVRRGDRFFPGTLFQDRHRRPNGRRAGKKTETTTPRMKTLDTAKESLELILSLTSK